MYFLFSMIVSDRPMVQFRNIFKCKLLLFVKTILIYQHKPNKITICKRVFLRTAVQLDEYHHFSASIFSGFILLL